MHIYARKVLQFSCKYAIISAPPGNKIERIKTMKTYSAKQIATWEKSFITVYDQAGYIESTRELGEEPLRSLFIEGFFLNGKIQADGTQRVMTAAGREIVIHSKSLGRALRKRAKQHQWERNSYLTSNSTRRSMAEMAGLNKNAFQAVAVMDAAVGIAESYTCASEIYTLMTPGEYHRFRRKTWTAPLEYLGPVKR